jgi:hypothetical protein
VREFAPIGKGTATRYAQPLESSVGRSRDWLTYLNPLTDALHGVGSKP